MRVLLFVTDLEIGGTPTVVRELATRLPTVGCESAVACLGRLGPVAEMIAGAGVRVEAFDARPWQLPSAVRRLRRLTQDWQIDVTFSLLVHANAVAAMAKVRHVQAIQTTQPYPRWHWRVQRWAARRTKQVVCCSPSVAAAARERSGIAAEKLVVIPNAVEDVAESPRRLERPMRVGFLGRLDPVKRTHLLVDAVERAGLPLHIFGDGPAADDLRRYAAGKNVTLHGFTPRAEAFAQIDVLCLTSLAEGMPMVLVEAMAAGIPVAALDAPGCRDVITHDRTGGLLPDVSSLADWLRRLNGDPQHASALATNALEEVRSRYTWDRVLPQYRAAFESELNAE